MLVKLALKVLAPLAVGQLVQYFIPGAREFFVDKPNKGMRKKKFIRGPSSPFAFSVFRTRITTCYPHRVVRKALFSYLDNHMLSSGASTASSTTLRHSCLGTRAGAISWSAHAAATT